MVVTRPAAQAAPLAARLAAAGREAVVFPLLEIQPLPDPAGLRAALSRLRDYAMVAFVSPNAIDAAFALIADWPPEVALAVVGEGSKAALARHGIVPGRFIIHSPRDPVRSDSETLLQALDIDALRGRKVLIVRGESGRELLADALRAHGVDVVPVAAYRRAAPALDEARRAQLVGLLDGGADWVITSSEALRNLLDMARQAAGDAGVTALRRQRLILPHIRIAETARALGFDTLLQTASGDDALVAALELRP
ncbi:hypothetical protein NCCP691_40440 [Noviherbaspirillum aridicola]|uniref:Uroporphyrinogen-III synthase n=1 Tax=Noviherbaspirillum aridicola TaxID=2849687 RepID=A0ABQ4Q9Y2_9BURK|nr:hypothetical protein NCCP691_40440 [Noviherbaspirillum aridicola]